MRIYEKKKFEVERVVSSKTICDLCKKEKDGDGWSPNSNTVLEVTVEIEAGTSYPGSNEVSAFGFDICPDCFNGPLTDWFRAQGVEPTEQW